MVTSVLSTEPWNDLSRGAAHWIDGQDEEARTIDLHPVMSGKKTEDEGLFIVQHHYWQQMIDEAARKEKGE